MAQPTRICLNMIVKNESKIIERCIKSVYHLIDTWCIVDTGSTDGTQEIIKNLLKDKPGILHEKPWINFGHNRNEALQLAQEWGEWTFLTDADMILVDQGFDRSMLDLACDGYDVIQDNGGVRYYNFRLLNASKNWKCIGVTHEYYSPEKGFMDRRKIDTLHFDDRGDGGSKSDKFERDIRLLTQGLIDEPGNPRYMFYLAQSYRDTQKYDASIHWYKECVKYSTWDEEKWYSEYMIGWCMSFAQKPIEETAKQLMYAWLMRPWRIEPLFHLALQYKNNQKWHQAYPLFKICASTAWPGNDLLFISAAPYEGLSLDEFGVAAYWVGNYEESVDACKKLLGAGYSPNERPRLIRNTWFGERALGKYSTAELEKYLQNTKQAVQTTFGNKKSKTLEKVTL
jgi:glycosyltransferase involved in cell wall biosynthesis